MHLDDLSAIVDDLRAEGSDITEIEVKRAAGGFPSSLAPTLSAFGNTPGGGLVILGLDEDLDFAAVGVYDPVAAKAALASNARQAVTPPLTVDVWDFVFEDAPVVVARVHELPSSGKPCRVKSSRKSFLRSYDGDYEMSEVEEQAFIANRATPRFDREAVEGTGQDDLNPALLGAYLASCRSSSTALADLSDSELLYRTGVTTDPERQLTVAGLLALGIYPQQHLPNCVIQASIAPRSTDPVGTRAADSRRFDGPIPLMLDEALRWVQRNTRTRIRSGPGGQIRDEPEFPVEAVRELLSNALIHRDLGPSALIEAITLKLDDRRLIVSNPGGLWGITVDRLGKVGVTSARNGHLLRICQNVRSREGNRVVEALASGIPTVLESLNAAGLVPPRFHDHAIRFTVTVPNHALLMDDDLRWLNDLHPRTPLSAVQQHALVAMRHGQTWTSRSLRQTFPMGSRQAHRELAGLVDAGLAAVRSETGFRTYLLVREIATALGQMPPRIAAPQRNPSVSGHGARVAKENAARLVHELRTGPKTLAELVDATGFSRRQAQYALKLLRDTGQITLAGQRGRRDSRYVLEP